MTIWCHEDPVPGIFNDGAFPVDRAVMVRQSMGELIIADKETGEVMARWPLGTLRPVPDAEFPRTLRLRQTDGEGGRLAIFDRTFNEGLTEWWPGLRHRLVFDKAALGGALRVALAAVAGLGLFFLALLPVLGQLGAHLVPPAFEQRVANVFLRHGDRVLNRINAARVCDSESVAPLLNRLVDPLREASGWPESVRVRVIDDPLPNAAAVTGGEIILFRGMLYFARNADELAGILAHEMGHVARRHAVRNLFVTSMNFFGFDQLLGNFSGQLVVHPVGGLMLTRREGRRAEYEADRSAIEILNRAGFNVRPLADILDRIAYLQGEKAVNDGWLATHPLSQKRARLIRDAAPPEPREPVLTAAEFSQLRAICLTEMPKMAAPQESGRPEQGSRSPHAPGADVPAENDNEPAGRAPAPTAGENGPKPREPGNRAGSAGGTNRDADAAAAPTDDSTSDSAEDGPAGDKNQDPAASDLGDWDTGGHGRES